MANQTISLEQWRATKVELITSGQGELDWLNAFVVTADEQISATLKEVKGDLNGAVPFKPLLVEMLLGDVAALLDRAAAYRKEAAELEVSAVTAAIEHHLAGVTIDKEEKLSLLALAEDPDALEKKGALASATEFSKGTAPLELGLAAYTQGRSDSLASQNNNNLARQELVKERAAISRERRTRLLDRLLAPGSALNFRERYERTLSLLREDVKDAYVRMICAHSGLTRLMDIQTPVPPPTTERPLEALISWTRSAMRTVEQRAERETEVDILIPFRQPKLTDTPLVPEALWNAQMADGADGAFEIKLSSQDFLKGLESPRIVQLGVSYVMKGNADQVAVRSQSISLKVFLPEQPLKIGGMDLAYRQPPLLFANVTPFGQGEPQWVSGMPVKNADPRGTWKFMVGPRVLGLSAGKTTRINIIEDLRLHLRLLALASPDPGKWSAND
jgi:hypothetical protein